MPKKKVMTVFGTRPEAIKMAPVVQALKSSDQLSMVVAVTAQHREMLDQVLDIFGITPDYDLNIMKEAQSLSEIITRTLIGLEEPLEKEKPDLILVHGDTATTFAGALSGFYHHIQVGHVEAGLRTHDKYSPYPEEMNRRLTGCLSDMHFAPLGAQRDNLLLEGTPCESIHVTGNTVIDALLGIASIPHEFTCPDLASIDYANRRVLLVTAHRRENLGEPLRRICRALKTLVETQPDVEVVWPVHMNPAVREDAFQILSGMPRIHLLDPFDYQTMVAIMSRCYLVLTDSGGLQEEAPSLNKPVLVLRDVTERPEGVESGTLALVGTDEERIVSFARGLLDDPFEYRRMAEARNPYGDGQAALRIRDAILWRFGINPIRPADFQG
ncbi:MAG TPA: UDP-N-acetylglucosamine 2-epimerase (non-hydrolyzing) [Firmicutes bacterium]|jgi:UDP-N-acetylglucosamine 2-epimerase (non-hydrolysing)|nr:UDP-N-acetylglucosamine 2-epimerase (non-hydrolyzing) [Bacillota bacterium]